MRGLILVFFLLVSANTLRSFYLDEIAAARLDHRPADSTFTSPGRVVLSLVSLEERLAAADVTWLSIVQWLGAGGEDVEPATAAGPVIGGVNPPAGAMASLSASKWDRLLHLGFVAVDLDPRYFTVYHSVAVHLAVFGMLPSASDQMLLRGRDELPHRWEFPFILSYNSYFLRNDFTKAAEWMQEAASKPGRPAYVPALAGRMKFQAGDPVAAISFLEVMLPALDEHARVNAEDRIKLLKTELRFRHFDEACRRYLTETGTTPPSGEELVRRGYVREPPVDFFDKPLRFDANCRARSEYMKVREDEAIDRAKKHDRGLEPTEPSIQTP